MSLLQFYEIVLEKYVSLGRDGEELHEPLTTRLEKGHIYRIVGENGVGKTRLILAIVGYSMNYHGEIYLPNYRKNSNFRTACRTCCESIL